MYVPLDLLDLLQQTGELKEEKADVVTRKTMKRSLTAEDFISMVQSGWVGTYGERTQRLADYLKLSLDQNHGIILAMEQEEDTKWAK